MHDCDIWLPIHREERATMLERTFFFCKSGPQSSRHSEIPSVSPVPPRSMRSKDAPEKDGRTPIDTAFERSRGSYCVWWILMSNCFTRLMNSMSWPLIWKNRHPRMSPAGSMPTLSAVVLTRAASHPWRGEISSAFPSQVPCGVNTSLDGNIVSDSQSMADDTRPQYQGNVPRMPHNNVG